MSEMLRKHGGRIKTPQDRPMRADQVENDAGGYVWEADAASRLRRFLVLGTDHGTYYTSARDHTVRNVEFLRGLIETDGEAVVNTIVEVSDLGLAPSNEQALYALAAAMSYGDVETRRYAGGMLTRVARTATHLYHFVTYMETMRGWGRVARKAVAEWYAQDAEKLAYQAVKYRQRDGWTHRDLLRLAHPVAGRTQKPVIDWMAHYGVVNKEGQRLLVKKPVGIIRAFELAQSSGSAKATAALVREFRLPREALKTEHLTDPEVNRALLDTGMPMHALIRNLANMTRYGIFESREYLKLVLAQVGSDEAIRKSRLHPMALLIALRTYQAGHGMRGGNTWRPVIEIVDALDEAFYTAFDNVTPAGVPIVLGIDVSGSMTQLVHEFLSAREAAVAMALVALHTEPDVQIIGYTNRAYPNLGLSRRMRLDTAMKTVPETGEGTDCSIPARFCRDHLRERIEGIVGYTDNQSWYGNEHTQQVIVDYRRKTGFPVRHVVTALATNEFTIADPNDPLSLNVAGLDTSAPAIISEFLAGRI